ncbi:MAG: carboxy-S-adenosyl-L-methionine synthase CmoA, partial [Bdellovibrionales bacterium]|nr:carboxy-S-adenosyl-L-methionine synthase CmoA [Bdellovibrionales bacterium]
SPASIRTMTQPVSIDTVFEADGFQLGDFRFDESVASVFDNMVERSIPNYWELQHLTAALAKRRCVSGSRIYDLGCSTGTTLSLIAAAIAPMQTELIGVDASTPMIEKCRQKLRRQKVASAVKLHACPVEDFLFDEQSASLCISHYTVQFLDPQLRPALVRAIYRSLLPGGCFLLSEKIRFDCPATQEFTEELYYDFKRRNGYSEREIQQKRVALEGVLRPLTAEQNVDLLRGAGFSRITPVLQGYCFVTFLAEKGD